MSDRQQAFAQLGSDIAAMSVAGDSIDDRLPCNGPCGEKFNAYAQIDGGVS